MATMPPYKVGERQMPWVASLGAKALEYRHRGIGVRDLIEMTNRPLAEELAVSKRTMVTRIYRILDKRNLRSRVQIAAWAIDQRELLR